MELVLSLIIVLFSAILHEVAHGFVADRLGDPTARLLGRLTLNPKSHIDPFMSILLPLMLVLSGSPVIFGAAKPVPVDPFNLRDGRKDMALVALAGPLTNIILAIVASILIRAMLAVGDHQMVGFLMLDVLTSIMQINIMLAIFNLLPIPPLDGSKVFAMLLPEKEATSYLSIGSFGMIILFFLLAFPIGGFSLSTFMFSLMRIAQNLLLPGL